MRHSMIVDLVERFRAICGAGVDGVQQELGRPPPYPVCKRCPLLEVTFNGTGWNFGKFVTHEKPRRGGFLPVFWDFPRADTHAVEDIGAVLTGLQNAWVSMVLDLKEVLPVYDHHLPACLIANNAAGSPPPHPGSVLFYFLDCENPTTPVTSHLSKLLTVSGTGESHRHYARQKTHKQEHDSFQTTTNKVR